jgi:hypothetical protein
MARILCALSGIEFQCTHMQMYLTSRESHHPIFDISTSRLLEVTPRWLDGELSPTENYLLYLALFNSTGLMDFRVPATLSADTPSIVAQNMDALANIVERIYKTGPTRIREQLHLPSFVITPDTKNLESSPDWIKIWEEAYKNYEDGYRTATLLERIERKETVLERYIKDRSKDISSYASRIADWAHDAGGFEKHADYIVLNEFDKPERMADYWRRIIIACAKTEAIWNIPDVDLTDLIEHCEEHIYHGSIYAHTLMSLLKAGAERKKNFLDLGDIDIGSNGISFRILDADTSVEDANKLALIDSAPLTEPVESQYPNKLAYIRAKMNWRMKQDYERSQAVQAKMEEIAAGPVLASANNQNRRASDNEGDTK